MFSFKKNTHSHSNSCWREGHFVQQLMKLQRESIMMWISTKTPPGNGAVLYLSIFVCVGASCKSCLCVDFELQDVLDHTDTHTQFVSRISMRTLSEFPAHMIAGHTSVHAWNTANVRTSLCTWPSLSPS